MQQEGLNEGETGVNIAAQEDWKMVEGFMESGHKISGTIFCTKWAPFLMFWMFKIIA